MFLYQPNVANAFFSPRIYCPHPLRCAAFGFTLALAIFLSVHLSSPSTQLGQLGVLMDQTEEDIRSAMMPSVVEQQDETVAAIGTTAVDVEKNALRKETTRAVSIVRFLRKRWIYFIIFLIAVVIFAAVLAAELLKKNDFSLDFLTAIYLRRSIMTVF
ncbi:hypothetical protein B0H14DRAFT_3467370 [Mycena olivaceomarginata]|nr:hypothetical protein B0H14DRAFT_3467370 [Mycena olivaceomarginata]